MAGAVGFGATRRQEARVSNRGGLYTLPRPSGQVGIQRMAQFRGSKFAVIIQDEKRMAGLDWVCLRTLA